MDFKCCGTGQRAATNWGFAVDCLSKAKERKRKKKKNLRWVPPDEVLARWWVAVAPATMYGSYVPGPGVVGVLRVCISGAGTAGATLQGLTCNIYIPD